MATVKKDRITIAGLAVLVFTFLTATFLTSGQIRVDLNENPFDNLFIYQNLSNNRGTPINKIDFIARSYDPSIEYTRFSFQDFTAKLYNGTNLVATIEPRVYNGTTLMDRNNIQPISFEYDSESGNITQSFDVVAKYTHDYLATVNITYQIIPNQMKPIVSFVNYTTTNLNFRFWITSPLLNDGEAIDIDYGGATYFEQLGFSINWTDNVIPKAYKRSNGRVEITYPKGVYEIDPTIRIGSLKIDTQLIKSSDYGRVFNSDIVSGDIPLLVSFNKNITLNVSQYINKLEIFDSVKEKLNLTGLFIEIGRNESYNITVVDQVINLSYEEPYIILNNSIPNFNYTANSTNITIYKYNYTYKNETHWHYVYESIDTFDFIAGEEYVINFHGTWKASVGSFAVDLVPTFNSFSLKEYAWWNVSFVDRVPIAITLSDGSSATDLQVLLNVTYDSGMQADMDDLRFVSNDNNTQLPAWNQTTDNSDYADVWVLADDVNGTIWMYYGNSGVSSSWNGYTVFPKLFDDFDDGSLNTTIWGSSLVTTESGTSLVIAYNAITRYILSKGGTGLYGVDINQTAVSKFKFTPYGTGNGAFGAVASATPTSVPMILFQPNYPTNSVLNTRSYVTTDNADNLGAIVTANVYSWYELRRNSTTNIQYYVNSSLVATHTTQVPTNENMNVSIMGAAAGFQIEVDVVFVRNYTNVAPTVSFGSEEEAPIFYETYINSVQGNESNYTVVVGDDTPNVEVYGSLPTYSSFSAELYINDSGYGWNYTVLNDTNTNITVNASLVDGYFEAYVVVNNSLGLTNTSDVFGFWVETEVPDITVNNPPNQTYVNIQDYDFNATAVDEVNNSMIEKLYFDRDNVEDSASHLWTFDEGTGTTAYDSVGSIDGALVNTPTWNNSGKYGDALSFNGSRSSGGQYVNLGTNSDFNLTYNITNWTLNAWVNYAGDSASDSGTIFGRYQAANNRREYFLQIRNSDDKVAFVVYNNPTTAASGTVLGNAVTIGSNTMITVTGSYYNATWSNITLYQNGAYVSTGILENACTNDYCSGLASTYIGAIVSSSTTPDKNFNGTIDNVGLWKNTLTAEQITQLYNNGVNHVIATFHFDEGSGTAVTDAIDGLNGVVTDATFENGKYGNALNFSTASTAKVVISNNPIINITGEITVAGWYFLSSDPNIDAGNTYRGMLGKGSSYRLLLEETRAVSWSIYVAGNRQKMDSAVGDLPIGTWALVVTTWKPNGVGTMYIITNTTYLNYNFTKTAGNIDSVVTGITIGREGSPTPNFPGLIDEPTIFNTALSGDEVAQLYNQGRINIFSNFSVNNNTLTNFNVPDLAEGNHTYYYNITDPSGTNKSEIRTHIVDLTAPSWALDSNNDSYVNDSNPYINLTLTELYIYDSDVFYSNDSWTTNYTSFVGSYDIDTTNWDDGNYQVYLWANDYAGNTAIIKQVNITVDNTAPTVYFVSPEPSNNSFIGVNYNYVNVTFVEDNLYTAILSWNGTNETLTCSAFNSTNALCSANKTSLSDGTYYYYVWGNDSLSNSAQTDGKFITIDTTNPSIILDSPDNDSYVKPNSYLNLSISDANLNATLYSNDSWTTNYTFIGSYDIYLLEWDDGEYLVNIWANDSAGNVNITQINVTVDSINPNIVLDDPTNNTFVNSEITVNLSLNDTNAISTALWSNDSWATNNSFATNYNITTSGWGDGEKHIWIWANDSANNVNITLVNFTIDTINPSIILDSPINGSYIATPTYVNLTITDTNLNVVLYSNDSWTTNYTDFVGSNDIDISAWSDGQFTISVWADDGAGRVNITEINITIDTVTPDINITSPANDTYAQASIELNFTYIEVNIDSCWYSLNGGSNTSISCVNETSITGFEDGANNITLWVNDSAGNLAEDTEYFTDNLELALSIQLSTDSILWEVNNATDPNNYLQPENQTNSIGIFVLNNTNDTVANIQMKSDLAASSYGWTLWIMSNETTNYTLTTSWQTIYLDFGVNSEMYLWLWANNTNVESQSYTWNDTLSIRGILT